MIEKELIDAIHDQNETMLSQVWQWSEINSGSGNLAGLATMHTTLKAAFSPLADSIESINFSPIEQIDMQGNSSLLHTGNGLLIKKRPELTYRILLCGHMDTVFSKNHHFQQVKRIDDSRINGPGVTDMKGGLAVILHALSAFEQSPLASTLGWDFFINADEEIGSPASGPYLEAMASNYQLALVYEPSMTPDGTLAYHRKGSGKFTVVVKGLAAHAGRDFAKGRNAICHLAEVISAISSLNGMRDELTINIGMIHGGTALNMVPDTAVVKLDVRYRNEEDKPWLLTQFNELTKNFNQAEGFDVTIDGGFGRPAKTITPACHQLFLQIQTVANQLGLQIGWQNSGGCCDGNNLALSGLPVVDTLGVRGDFIHSDKEYLITDSLVERAQLSCLLLLQLAHNLKEHNQ